MRAMNALLVVAGLITGIAAAEPAHAQGSTSATESARVRVTVRDYTPSARLVRGRLVGQLQSADDSTITVRDGRGRDRQVARADVSSFEVSRGRGDRGRGARRGFLIGAAIGVAAGLALGSDDGFVDPGAAALLLGGASGVLGLGVGYSVAGEKWESTPPPRLAALPVRNARIGIQLAF
jgi:hypothetical protein